MIFSEIYHHEFHHDLYQTNSTVTALCMSKWLRIECAQILFKTIMAQKSCRNRIENSIVLKTISGKTVTALPHRGKHSIVTPTLLTLTWSTELIAQEF